MPVLRNDARPLERDDILANVPALVVYSQGKFFVPYAVQSQSRLLTAPRDYYVDAANGSDNNDGMSWAKAFLTLQKAQDTLVKFNLNGFNVTVHVANGTYAPMYVGSIGGFGTITYIGNTATPSLCTISAAVGPCVLGTGTGDYQFNGFKLQSFGRSPGVPSVGLGPRPTAGRA